VRHGGSGDRDLYSSCLQQLHADVRRKLCSDHIVACPPAAAAPASVCSRRCMFSLRSAASSRFSAAMVASCGSTCEQQCFLRTLRYRAQEQFAQARLPRMNGHARAMRHLRSGEASAHRRAATIRARVHAAAQRLHLHDGAVADVLGARRVVERAQRLLHVRAGGRAARDHQRQRRAAQRVHEQLRHMGRSS